MILGREGFQSTAQIFKMQKEKKRIASSCNDDMNYIIKSPSPIVKSNTIFSRFLRNLSMSFYKTGYADYMPRITIITSSD